MSRPQGRPRGPPPAGLKGFGSMSPAAKPGAGGAASFGSKGKGTGGFSGFETARSKSGLAYVAERSDLSAISDAHVVVSFKNLVKKDSTTKARALEDLLSHAQANPFSSSGGGVEDAVLEAWVQCYPRLSIDDARRVRELSHTLQLALMQSARKRMERHIPKVASAWLAGTYDRDRAVAKAASDGLASFLTTDEKTTMFWKRLQPQILEDATAAMQETAATLSDMRSTTQDDADLKYYRVLYSSLSLVLALLRKLSIADTESLHHAYTQFFAVEAVWSSAALSPDSHVRRVTYELLLTTLETRPTLLEAQLPRLTKLLTQEAPKTSQSGSVIDYVKVLQKLTVTHPEIWTDGGHPFTRLRPLVDKGSQGTAASPAAPSHNFWTQLDALFSSIPSREIAAEAASSVLASFRKGLSSRDEPQSNAIDGWTAYLSMVRRLVDVVTPEDSRVALVEANVFPLFDRFLGAPKGSASTVWATGAHVTILTRASLLIARPAYADIVASARTEWERLASNFCGRMANSLPEVSKEFKASQQEIANEGDRWFALVEDIHRSVLHVEAQQTSTEGTNANLVEDVLEKPTLSLLQNAVDLLKKRNFKPFGAAQLVSAAFDHAPHLLQNNSTGETIVESLFPIDDTEQLSLVVASPSAPALLSCLRSLANMPAFHNKYTAIYASIVSLLLENKDQDPETTAKSIALLISDASDVALATSRRNNNLQEYLGGACYATAQGKLSSWDLFHAVSSANALSTATGKKLASDLVRSLGSNNANSAGVLTALQTIATRTPDLLADDEELHLELVTKLLGMMEIRDTALSAKVHALRALIDGSSSRTAGGNNNKSSQPARLIKIVQDNLDSAGPNSLEVDTLVEQAASIAQSPEATDEDKENLFPNTNIWMQTMQAFFQSSATGLNPSLALASNVGGAYLLVPSNKPSKTQRPAVSRDRHGSSIPARMAAYTTQLLSTVVETDGVSIAALPQEFQVELLYLLYLVAELGSDQVAVSDAHSLWGNLSDPFVLAAAEDSIASIRSTLASVLLAARGSSSASSSSLADALISIMLQQTQQPTALAVYTTRALSGLLQTRMEGRTFSATTDEEYLVKQNLWKTGAGTTLGALAFLTGYGEVLVASKSVSNFCNRLISDIAGASPKASPAKAQSALENIVLLNAGMAVYEVGALPTASNRLMFAVKQITSWFGKEEDDDEDEDAEKEELDTRIAAESCRALQRLLPCIKDMYGPHWERSIKFSISLWDRAAAVASKPSSSLDEHLPYVYASLKLIGALETIDEPNDDLEDTLALFSEAKWTGMRRLLLALAHRSPSVATSSRTQPQSVVDTLLSRMAGKTPLNLLMADTADLYTLVASDSRDIQAAGYGFLHRALPAQQEELSFNIILEKKEAKLPDELLSLLLGAPTLEAYPDDVLATFPTPVRGYLLAWQLVFDAFSTASAKVRSDYASHLAASGHITALLDFTFDVLGHSAAHPLNLEREGLADRASITEYDLKTAEASLSDEKHMHQLLVHLYYLTLKYVPGLFKAWYMACRTKQTTVAVEAWTAKYISALVVEEVLDEVAEWGNNQEGADGAAGDDDHEMIIKTNKRAREVVAGYEVDELMLSIALRLPANYPIDNVAVVGLNRVAVDEKKWQSWLMITQGVIAFANGSLVEGLAAFQRNVLGALKGHTECAICYSIISVEKRVPEKRCGTCKNMFHKSCLYKWFLSSNQNSCPLCRNPISFLGAEKFKRRDVEY